MRRSSRGRSPWERPDEFKSDPPKVLDLTFEHERNSTRDAAHTLAGQARLDTVLAMDPAVALVEAYLQINGYFTVTEYGIVESIGHARLYRASTDLDVLAVHFPGSGHPVLHRRQRSGAALELAPDAVLGAPVDRIDMIIGEVKEGRAELNRGARDPRVLEAVLTRFGCCTPAQAPRLVRDLLEQGVSDLPPPHAHRVRLMAFGTSTAEPLGYACQVVSLQHVLSVIEGFVHENWDILRHAPSKDSILGLLMLMEKVRASTEQQT